MEGFARLDFPSRWRAGRATDCPVRDARVCVCGEASRRHALQVYRQCGTTNALARGEPRTAKPIRWRILERRIENLCSGAGPGEKAVPGANFQRRSRPVLENRSARTGESARRYAARRTVILGLGRENGCGARGPLQPNVLSQRLGLAA